MEFWIFLGIYIFIFAVWALYAGSAYSSWPSARRARWFLASFVWPVAVVVLLVRFFGRATIDAFRRD